jgi:IS30 family transposase
MMPVAQAHKKHQPVEVHIMPGPALSLDERVTIEVGIAGGRSNSKIADELGRDACTVRREITRNGGRGEYSALAAQGRADRMRARPKPSRLETDPDLAAHVAARLALRDSPMTISIELRNGTHGRRVASISHECIYQSIYHGRGLAATAHRGLHLRRRRRKPRGSCTVGTHSLGQYRPIAERPAIANERTEVGHLEGDLIIGAYNRSALITIFDRACRRCWLAQPANKTADAVHDTLLALLERIPAHLRRTLTWDQGAEIARHHEISQHCGIEIYIADKHAPWQRPTNENGNALVRRYVGKGTDLNTITPEHLAWIEHRINTIPRRSLNWHTANDAYTRLSAPTP